MSLEEALAANTAALIANTEAHAKLAAAATAAAGTKSESKSDDADAAAEEKKRLAAEKRKAAAEAKKKAEAEKKAEADEKPAEAPDLSKLVDGVTPAKLKTLAGGFLKGDDEGSRDANKEKILAAFNHLGVAKLGEVTDDEDRAKLAAYIVYWTKGAEVDFEAVDEIVMGIIGGGDDGGDDDLLG